MAQAQNKPQGKPPIFATQAGDGVHNVVHSESGTVIWSISGEKGELAEETKDWANKLAKMSATKIAAEHEAAEGNKKVVIGKIIELTGKTANAASTAAFVPKAKSRDTYRSAARLSFQADNVTDKDKKILEAIEATIAEGKNPTFPSIAATLGVSVNQISGAVSVLVAKGVVSTVRDRIDGKVARTIKIEMDWRNLTPRPPKVKAEKPAKEPKPEKEPKPQKEAKSAKAGAKTEDKAAV